MALPPMTPEQRADALAKAARVREERKRLKDDLRQGTLTLAGFIARADGDDVIGKMKVSAVIQSLPGMGKVKTAHLMHDLGIAEDRRVRGLGAKQRAALVHKFEPVPA